MSAERPDWMRCNLRAARVKVSSSAKRTTACLQVNTQVDRDNSILEVFRPASRLENHSGCEPTELMPLAVLCYATTATEPQLPPVSSDQATLDGNRSR